MTQTKKAPAANESQIKEIRDRYQMIPRNITTLPIISKRFPMHNHEQYEINRLKDTLREIVDKADQAQKLIDLCDGSNGCAKNCGESWVLVRSIKIIANVALM